MNSIKTVLLLGSLTGLFMFAGGALAGQSGIILGFSFAAVLNLGAYWFSDKLVLKMHNARLVEQHEAPELYGIVANLTQKSGMPSPRLYIVDNPAPNAFATGRSPSHAAVAVTTGLLKIMSHDEVEGVLAHELSHVKNYDTLISSMAATLAGAIMMIASMARWAALFGGFGGREDSRSGGIFSLLAMMILAPVAALMIQMAVSRSREYEADASGARMVGHPHGLASGLRKLGQFSGRVPMSSSPAMGHLYIVNAFSAGGFSRLFSSHPPIEKRIAKLTGQI
jgi:heat shock protein HtpX